MIRVLVGWGFYFVVVNVLCNDDDLCVIYGLLHESK